MDDERDERRPEETDGDSGVGPTHAPGNAGWNDPVSDEPETLERAVRSPTDPEDGAEARLPNP